MIDETSGTPRTPSLQLPLQAAPVDRSRSRSSAVSADGGVDPDFGFGDIFDAIKTYGPAVAAGLSALSDRRLKDDVVPVAWGR